MSAWIYLRPDEPRKVHLTIDILVAHVETKLGSVVWPANTVDMELISGGFQPALTKRIWTQARRQMTRCVA